MGRAAAFFDLDGTLIGCNSAVLYMRYLRRTRQVSRSLALKAVYHAVRYRLGLLDVERAFGASLEWIRGRLEADVAAECRRWYESTVRRRLYPEMVAVVRRHRRAGHVPVIISSATRYLGELAARDAGIAHLLVNRLHVREGRFTGTAERPYCYGRGKIYWARRFAAEYGCDLRESFFYTDSVTDLPLLELVGKPRVVNPDPLLRWIAWRRGWPVLRPRLGEGNGGAGGRGSGESAAGAGRALGGGGR